MKKEIFFDEVFDSQEQYRIVLDAMAHPGKIYKLTDFEYTAPNGISHASAIIAFSLLNSDVSFHVVENASIDDYLALNTNAIEESVENADFIFMKGNDNGEFLFETKQGTLPYPEESATIIVDVEEVGDIKIENSLEITFKGPGIEKENKAFFKGLNTQILQNAKEINFEFPLGIDFIFCDKNNNICCLPRSNNFEYNPLILTPNLN